jgi:hypothetical protein
MSKTMNENIIISVLDWSYDKAISGIPGFSTAQELADEYLDGVGSLHRRVNRMIRWQNTKSATSGFVSGLGGVITLPVSIPANFTAVMYIQLRMIAAIAWMGGHDIREDRVRTLSYICLTGNAAGGIIKDCGILIGKKLTENAIKNISREAIAQINRKVGFRLLTKFGEKGIINLGKAIPIVGGLIGGAGDLISTNVIGNVARNTFIK